MKKFLIAGFVGIILGVIGSKILFVGSFLNLVPWALVGLATGIYANTKKEAIVNGALYGFLLSFIFMATGYTGTEPVVTKILPFLFFGVFGAFCGMILAFIGLFIKKIVKKGSL